MSGYGSVGTTGKQGRVVSVAVELAHTGEVRELRGFGLQTPDGRDAVFCDGESAQAHWHPDPDVWLAGVLAIKRALLKALGPSAAMEPLTAIEVVQSADGRWTPLLRGSLAQAADQRAVGNFAINLSVTAGTATATVIAIRTD